MKRLLILIVAGLTIACLLVGAAASARAEDSGTVESPESAEKSPPRPAGEPAAEPAGEPTPTLAATRPAAGPRPRGTTGDSTRVAAPRHVPPRERLDDIRIEGERTAPEVLFITGRDRARFRDPLHWRTVSGVEELERTIVPLRELCFPHPGF